jgi:hypothetical protein
MGGARFGLHQRRIPDRLIVSRVVGRRVVGLWRIPLNENILATALRCGGLIFRVETNRRLALKPKCFYGSAKPFAPQSSPLNRNFISRLAFSMRTS